MRPIDADALVEYLDCNLLNECLRNERFDALDAVKMVLRKVYTMPTLDVASVVHASWYGQGDGYANGEIVLDEWFCGNCNYCIETDDPGELPKFCPNCGAKMEVALDNGEDDDPQTV